MTPNLNANPLAALIANATKTTAGTANPSNIGAPLASQGVELSESESPFFNILQIHKTESSELLEYTSASGQSPLAPVAGTRQGLVQPVPGLTIPGQAINVLSQQEQALNPDLEALSEENPELQTHPLPIPVQGGVTPGGEAMTGARPPPGGNPLPPALQTGQSGQQNAQEKYAEDLIKSVMSASSAAPASKVPQGPLTNPVASGLAQPVPAPEFMEQLVKFPKAAPGVGAAGTSPGLTQAISERVLSLSETDVANAELVRGTAAVTAPDRQIAVQAAPAAIPLSRLAGAPGWDQGLGQRILWMVDNGLNKAELRLDPPHLGSVNVRISMQDDQAQLLFQAVHPAAREALESALPRLREMFAQQGLELTNADVSDQNDSSADDRSGQKSEQFTGDTRPQSEVTASGDKGDQSSDSAARLAPEESQSAGNSLIDEFV